MVKMLRRRPRPDTLLNEKRRMTNYAGRLVYLALLVALMLAGLNYLFGDFVYFRADGLVLRHKTVIASTYVARVEDVAVAQGSKVSKGDVLLRLQSAELLERLADLSARRAQLAAREVDFRIRAATVAQLLPLAQKRENQAAGTVDKFEELLGSGFATSLSYGTALRTSFDAQQDSVRLVIQDQALKEELSMLERARHDADTALENLKDHYGGGVVRSTVDGTVGASVPSVGNVYRPGESILTVHWGEPFVLAYLPRRYLFSINVGQEVAVSDGRHEVTGIISEILPITAALPSEFQNTFKPRDRNQLAKIRFSSPAPFSLHDKVTIKRARF